MDSVDSGIFIQISHGKLTTDFSSISFLLFNYGTGDYMIIGVIVEVAVGLMLIVFGLLIWKKQKVSLLHDYHYRNVKKDDIPAYSRMIGIGLILRGAGICLTGVLNLFESPLWWVPFAAGFAAGIPFMHKAQKRYNGSWFS